MRIVLPAMLVLALLPAATVSAVTSQEIVALTKAGVSEPIILALIERDKTIFTIGPEQLLALQKDGVSDTVILAMIRSGREEPPPQVAPAPPPPAPPYDTPEPNVVIVGQGPGRSTSIDSYNGGVPYVMPYFFALPYPVPVQGRVARSHRAVREMIVPASPFGMPESQLLAPPLPVGTPAPGANGIFFSTPARGIFFSR